MKIGIFLIIVLVAFTFIFGLMRQGDNSMSPAIRQGDLILYYRMQKNYESRDCVVVKKDGITQVVRIVAKGGDTVDITRNGLKINGFLQQEKDIDGETLPYRGKTRFPIKVPAGEYFVLCDTRTQTRDSRVYGCVSSKDIKGSVMAILRRKGF